MRIEPNRFCLVDDLRIVPCNARDPFDLRFRSDCPHLLLVLGTEQACLQCEGMLEFQVLRLDLPRQFNAVGQSSIINFRPVAYQYRALGGRPEGGALGYEEGEEFLYANLADDDALRASAY
ncbi:MAG TPA: hypothetical protein VNQ14_09440 [Woeseiaceae bacterium]|nr:hypothetical protein [Woeseiaceae bacterium]